MWWECKEDRNKRNFIDRQIRKFEDIHEYAVNISFVTCLFCLFYGFSILQQAKQTQPINQTMITFGQIYLACSVASFILIGVHAYLDHKERVSK